MAGEVSGHAAVDRVIRSQWLGLLTLAEERGAAEQAASPSPTRYVAAIRDDFHYWHDVQDEADHAGKMFLVSHNDSDDSDNGASDAGRDIEVGSPCVLFPAVID